MHGSIIYSHSNTSTKSERPERPVNAFKCNMSESRVQKLEGRKLRSDVILMRNIKSAKKSIGKSRVLTKDTNKLFKELTLFSDEEPRMKAPMPTPNNNLCKVCTIKVLPTLSIGKCNILVNEDMNTKKEEIVLNDMVNVDEEVERLHEYNANYVELNEVLDKKGVIVNDEEINLNVSHDQYSSHTEEYKEINTSDNIAVLESESQKAMEYNLEKEVRNEIEGNLETDIKKSLDTFNASNGNAEQIQDSTATEVKKDTNNNEEANYSNENAKEEEFNDFNTKRIEEDGTILSDKEELKVEMQSEEFNVDNKECNIVDNEHEIIHKKKTASDDEDNAIENASEVKIECDNKNTSIHNEVIVDKEAIEVNEVEDNQVKSEKADDNLKKESLNNDNEQKDSEVKIDELLDEVNKEIPQHTSEAEHDDNNQNIELERESNTQDNAIETIQNTDGIINENRINEEDNKKDTKEIDNDSLCDNVKEENLANDNEIELHDEQILKSNEEIEQLREVDTPHMNLLKKKIKRTIELDIELKDNSKESYLDQPETEYLSKDKEFSIAEDLYEDTKLTKSEPYELSKIKKDKLEVKIPEANSSINTISTMLANSLLNKSTKNTRLLIGPMNAIVSSKSLSNKEQKSGKSKKDDKADLAIEKYLKDLIKGDSTNENEADTPNFGKSNTFKF